MMLLLAEYKPLHVHSGSCTSQNIEHKYQSNSHSGLQRHGEQESMDNMPKTRIYVSQLSFCCTHIAMNHNLYMQYGSTIPSPRPDPRALALQVWHLAAASRAPKQLLPAPSAPPAWRVEKHSVVVLLGK